MSTPIPDVVQPYGARDLVRIARGPEQFAREIAAALAEDPAGRRARADAWIAGLSWSETVARMREIVARYGGVTPDMAAVAK